MIHAATTGDAACIRALVVLGSFMVSDSHGVERRDTHMAMHMQSRITTPNHAMIDPSYGGSSWQVVEWYPALHVHGVYRSFPTS